MNAPLFVAVRYQSWASALSRFFGRRVILSEAVLAAESKDLQLAASHPLPSPARVIPSAAQRSRGTCSWLPATRSLPQCVSSRAKRSGVEGPAVPLFAVRCSLLAPQSGEKRMAAVPALCRSPRCVIPSGGRRGDRNRGTCSWFVAPRSGSGEERMAKSEWRRANSDLTPEATGLPLPPVTLAKSSFHWAGGNVARQSLEPVGVAGKVLLAKNLSGFFPRGHAPLSSHVVYELLN